MESIKNAVNHFILDPKHAELLALVKAARNGAVYGAKVRFPHALVMVFLFRSGSLRTKLALILRATRTHARNLATFAFLYKALMYLLRHTPRSLSSDASILAQDKEARYDALLAGLLGGYAVFGRGSQSSVNRQIVIYVFARVVLGLADLGAQQSGAWIPDGVRQQVIHGAWPVFAAGSWGLVMWLYRWHPEVVQPSMRSSMTYIYTNADFWTGWKNFLVYNK